MTARTKRFNARLTHSDYATIARKAQQADKSVSDYIVSAALKDGADSSLEIAVADLIAGLEQSMISALARIESDQIEREEKFKSGLRLALKDMAETIIRERTK